MEFFSVLHFFYKFDTMITNKLSLNIPDILTPCVLRIEDTSIYNDLMPYVCPRVQVQIPGFKDCAVFTEVGNSNTQVKKNFVLNLSACNLGIQSNNCDSQFDTLPDGVYVIKYSNSPNDALFVEYNHLRVNLLKVKIKQYLSELTLAACEPSVEVEEKFKHLMKINQYIDAAKAKAEWDLDVDGAVALYGYAKKLLDEYSCKLF